MHGVSMGAALAWPERVDLSGHRVMLDIGGGSGAHAIGAARQWAKLQVIIFDLAPVCDLAGEFFSRHGLQDRIRTQVGDMWVDTFPPADLHLYSQIYHDWPPDRRQLLTRKSFEGLEPGGRVILHEMLYDDRKTGPFSTAAMNINMLLQYRPAVLGAGVVRDARGSRVLRHRSDAYVRLLQHRHRSQARLSRRRRPPVCLGVPPPFGDSVA